VGQYADELQGIVDTYVTPDVTGMKNMYMQMAGGEALYYLAVAEHDADVNSIFDSQSSFYSFERDYYLYTSSPTKEEFFKMWCDRYYLYSGDPSLREE
jgi:hypothetical protein